MRLTDQTSRTAAGSAAPELSRDLGFFAVFTTATGTMIGAGIFVLPGIAAEGAGPGAALSFLFAGIIAAIAALSVCELATAMPKAGGPYYFVSRAMGPLVGSVVGLGAWLALVLKGAFALVGLGQYVFYFSPVPVLLTAVAGGVLLVAANLAGARVSGILQNVIVLALLAILGVFMFRGLFAIEVDVLRPLLPFGWSGVLATTGVVFISYLGIVKAAAVAEEVEDPGRNLPAAILASVVLVTVLYVSTMVIVTGVLPVPEIVAAAAPLADAGGVFLGAAGAVMMAVSGILATLSTGNAAILSSSRYPFAMARDALMTPWISHIHRRFRTPSRSIMVTGGVMIVLVLLLDVEGLAKLGGVFGMIVFSLVNLSVIILRRTDPAWYNPAFRVPLHPVLPAFGAVAALAPIPQLGLVSHAAALGFIAVGVGWYLWHLRRSRQVGARIQPDYGLADQLREIRQVQALEDRRRDVEEVAPAEGPTVVAELVQDKPNKHILAAAAALASRYGSPLDVVVVTEVPYQSPLESAAPTLPGWWVDRVRTRVEEHGVPLRFHHVLARDRAHAVLTFARPETKVILLDWHEEFRLIPVRRSYVDKVLRRSLTRLAILKYRGHKRYDRILVATAGSPYAVAEIEMADAVAAFTGARLTLMMVLPPDASPVREQQARDYLKHLDELTETAAELRITKGTDVTAEILKAGYDQDLIVLGATRELSLRSLFGGHLVGRIADRIAERAEGSVLVTKDPAAPRRASHRLKRIILRILRPGAAGPDVNGDAKTMVRETRTYTLPRGPWGRRR